MRGVAKPLVVLLMVPMLVGVTLLIFIVTHIVPVNPLAIK